VKRKALLWISTAICLAAPTAALGLRWRDEHRAAQHLARGLAALEAPLARNPSPEALDWTTASREFQRARSLDPGGTSGRLADALVHVARTYEDLSRGELVLAQTEATTASRMAPEHPHVSFAAAVATLRRGEAARAERMLDALDHYAVLPPTLRARIGVLHIDVLLDAGRAHDALTLAEALDHTFAQNAAVVNRLGLVRAAVADIDGARAAFNRARVLDARDPSPLINLARLARGRGELTDARTLLEMALGVEQENGEAWLAYGVVLSELGPEHTNTARAAVQRASRLRPDDAEPWVAQGDLDMRESQWTRAIESFREALRRDAANAAAHTNLGVALARTGDRRAALRAFQEATERAPGTGAAWNGLGAMRMAAGQMEAAVGALQQAAVLLPEDPNPTLNLGIALSHLARWSDAAQAFRETLRRAPDNEVALRRLMAMQPDEASRARIARLAGVTNGQRRGGG
jgi:tetratricopeptide (TPR) repeat protein